MRDQAEYTKAATIDNELNIKLAWSEWPWYFRIIQYILALVANFYLYAYSSFVTPVTRASNALDVIMWLVAHIYCQLFENTMAIRSM